MPPLRPGRAASGSSFPAGLADDPGCNGFGPADSYNHRVSLAGSGGELRKGRLDSTYAPGVLAGPVVVRFDVRGGDTKAVYRVPSTLPIPDGVVVEGGSIVILDSQGERLATVGPQSPPGR